jgi:hypothetical protein
MTSDLEYSEIFNCTLLFHYVEKFDSGCSARALQDPVVSACLVGNVVKAFTLGLTRGVLWLSTSIPLYQNTFLSLFFFPVDMETETPLQQMRLLQSIQG